MSRTVSRDPGRFPVLIPRDPSQPAGDRFPGLNSHMELLDEDRLVLILQTSVSIVLGQKPITALTSTLLDIDEHVRSAFVTNLVSIFRRGMALALDLAAFDTEIEKYFAEEKLLSRALHAFWKKNGSTLPQQYAQVCPLDDRLVDLKWVASLPADSKFGLESNNISFGCLFVTTKGRFALDFTPNGVNNLLNEVNAIQAALQELK
jgi:hypothetical protein